MVVVKKHTRKSPPKRAMRTSVFGLTLVSTHSGKYSKEAAKVKLPLTPSFLAEDASVIENYSRFVYENHMSRSAPAARCDFLLTSL